MENEFVCFYELNDGRCGLTGKGSCWDGLICDINGKCEHSTECESYQTPIEVESHE